MSLKAHLVPFLVVCFFTTHLVCSQSLRATANFKGDEYIRYEIVKHVDTRKDKITVRFKTLEAYGVLLYSCGTQGDFLLLELKRGKILYTGDFGSTDEESGVHQIMLDQQYNNNMWHSLSLLRENGTHVYLNIDGRKKSHLVHTGFRQLNLDTYLYIGGISERERINGTCYNVRKKKNYVGCLSNLRFNSRDILYGAYEKFDMYQTVGEVSFVCPAKQFEIISFRSESSALLIEKNVLNRNSTSYSIELRTFEPRGHIVTHKCTGGDIELDLISGTIRLTISFLGSFSGSAAQIDSKIVVNDGDWHMIKATIKRNESTVALEVDKEKKIYKFQPHFNLHHHIGLFMSLVQFGGSTPHFPGLITCFRSLAIDGKQVRLDSPEVRKRRSVNGVCQLKDLCFPNPCLHGSKCTQYRQVMKCECNGTGYQGNYCEQCIYKRTCDEIWQSGKKESGLYKICPNNERIFTVYCDMKLKATVINHNIKKNTQVKEGYIMETSTTHFLMHDVEYDVSWEAILDLIDQSPSCRQYIRYDCKSSYLLLDLGKKRHIHYKGARWLSRDYVVQKYWGGSNDGNRTCACGMDQSCAKKSGTVKDCNCDVGDSTWRFDAGYITDKNVLPVTGIQFSRGVETNEDSFFTLGRLECFGMIPRPTLAATQVPTTTRLLLPTLIDSSMFVDVPGRNKYSDNEIIPSRVTYHTVNYDYDNESVSTDQSESSSDNETVIVEMIRGDPLSEPWFLAIVVVGSILCLLFLLIFFVLFRKPISHLFLKCVYGKHVNKPRIEIEDYNRYSTATEESSDWDIHKISTTFPTSTPEPSYGPTDDESVNMRVRTMDDVRGKRRFKRLHGWSSQTASAPTIVGGSKPSFTDISNHFYIGNSRKSSAKQYDSKTNECFQECESIAETAYSTTATDGGGESVAANSEFSNKSSHRSTDSSMKESEYTSTPVKKKSRDLSTHQSPSHVEFTDIENTTKSHRADSQNGSKSSTPQTGGSVCADQVKAYYPVLPINGFRDSSVRRAHPAAYGNHVAVMNSNMGNFALLNGSVARFVPISKRSPDNTPLLFHSTIDEREDDLDKGDNQMNYDNARNLNGFYGDYESPNSEKRLLFGDAKSREECTRKVDEQIKLLKKKVIEKATTSADDSM